MQGNPAKAASHKNGAPTSNPMESLNGSKANVC